MELSYKKESFPAKNSQAEWIEGAHQILAKAATAGSEEQWLAEVAQGIKERCAADACDILLRTQGDGLILKASTIKPEFIGRMRLGRGVGVCGQVLLSGEPVHVNQKLLEHPVSAYYPDVEEPSYESCYAVPLRAGDELAPGVVFLRRLGSWRLGQRDKQLIEQLVKLISGAFASYRSGYEAGAGVNKLGALSEVTKTIASSPYLEEIFQLLVNLTAESFHYISCNVRLLDEQSGDLVLRASHAKDRNFQRKRAIRLDGSIAGRAIRENRPIAVADVQSEPEYADPESAIQQGLHAMICVPLMVQNRAIGVMSCYTGGPHEFNEDEIKALETLAKQAAFSIEHAKLQVRSTLMQEMHHRVKNNLQQVASLLRLQMRHSQGQSLEEALGDSLSRILAIAAVHDLLSREDLDHVDMNVIAETLTQNHQQSLLMPGKEVGFEVRGDQVRLGMMQATQVALIMNELISNAIEHGFVKSEQGEVHITIEERNGEVGLWVSNNGDALQTDFELARHGNLGLQIVDSLAHSLGGHLKMEEIFGWTVAEVKFRRLSGE